MSELEDGKKFSEVVKTAKSLGYTEPGLKIYSFIGHYNINVYSVFNSLSVITDFIFTESLLMLVISALTQLFNFGRST
jgi:hypothetical protein